MTRVTETAPAGARVAWTYPGYISIVLSNGIEIAFGDSLSTNTGYSWNDFDLQGTNTYADSFEDLGDIEAIVNKLWEQTAQLTKEEI
jgi:NADH dehydrogenase FAD-containing subunit